MKKVYTNNHGWLNCEEGFQFMRGIHHARKRMGFAYDDKGDKYDVRVATCGLPNCYCAASARLVKKLPPPQS
jgi:hypothetical protein